MMLLKAGLAFVGGMWAGNGAPHLFNGIVRQSYPCKLGNDPTTNVIAGGVAMATSPLLFLAAGGSKHRSSPWIFGALGALTSLLLHARSLDAGRLQTMGKPE